MFHELLQTTGRLKRPHETVWGVNDDFKLVESHACPMSTCAAPAGSPCRTGKAKVAIQYHTARFRLVPQLAKALSVPTPAVRKPGSVWTELPRPVNGGVEPVGHVRLGYCRASRGSPSTHSWTPRRGRGDPGLGPEEHPRQIVR